ncbi:MAG: DUF1592 domain-containing protein [Gemmataceae bacterium]|nr:DUF1592 domain-containing protein [Gemmataceae bacterium]MDW8264667.1 DUF1592 domain-containing protein [Gemmataceae bacterium]
MQSAIRWCFVVVGMAAIHVAAMPAEENRPLPGPPCARAVDDFFQREVWAKVGAALCMNCHKQGGDAEESRFVLHDPRKAQGHAQDEVLRHNRDAFCQMARTSYKGKSRLLLKASGSLDHGGGEVLKPDSTGYRLLAEFVRRLHAPPSASVSKVDPATLPPFFEGVSLLDPPRLLRRATLSLVGRLPTDAERAAVTDRGFVALPGLLDRIMTEDAFYDRLREGFNDIFLTAGLSRDADSILSYDHFSRTRHWTQSHDLSHVPEKERTKARYKLDADYRKALVDEPLRLIEYIVRHDRPFTEIVTADYIMVSPYTARGYGIFEEVRDRFKNPNDPFEYIPVKLKALKGRTKAMDQESPTGFYPHAGLLSTFQYLRRYPTTETNRNRLRARMFYLHFLGVDALELAARVSDAAAVSAKYPIPTMQASECVVCHKSIDPVAGCFQDYYSFDGVYGRRKGGWYTDMFPAGFEGETLPASERWRALQWLGERTAQDPRFATTMVGHVYYVLIGRSLLQPPKDLDDPLYSARLRAHLEQRRQVEAIAERFAKSGYNLKSVFKEWIMSDFYRVDGLTTAVTDPARRAELEDVGIVRLLSPEQLERKIAAIFGQPWGRLHDQLAVLYGGIDAREVTERPVDPSGAMGAIQRMMANDVACKNTLRDFARPPAERRLFPEIEPNVLPGASAEADARIRRTIVHLHDLLLGRRDAIDSEEVTRTYELFAGVVADARRQGKFDEREAYFCRQVVPNPPPDPHYTIRAWRAVVTYLLRRPEFLYE